MHGIYAPPAGRCAWITLIGPDTSDFLHRLTTADVRNLPLEEGTRACFLTAQGKLRAFFTLWNYRPSEYAFELEAGASGEWKKSLLEAIDQYTFAEKMALSDVSALGTIWIFADPSGDSELLSKLGAPGLEPLHTLALDEEIRLCHQGSLDYGRPWITAWGRPERLRQWTERVLAEAQTLDTPVLESWRVHSVRPALGAELTHETIPLEAGLTDAIAQAKGCYPGQEVIERIVSLGSPARRLCEITGQGEAPSPGTAVLNEAEPPATVGEITSVARSGDEFAALAYLRKIHAKEGLSVRFAETSATGTVKRIAPYAPN